MEMKNILYTLVIIVLGILCGYLLSAYVNLKKKKRKTFKKE